MKDFKLFVPTPATARVAFVNAGMMDFRGTFGSIYDSQDKLLKQWTDRDKYRTEVMAYCPWFYTRAGSGGDDHYVEGWVLESPDHYRQRWLEIVRISGHGSVVIPHLNVFGDKMKIETYTNGEQVLLPFLSLRLTDTDGNVMGVTFRAPDEREEKAYFATPQNDMTLKVGTQRDQPFELRIFGYKD